MDNRMKWTAFSFLMLFLLYKEVSSEISVNTRISSDRLLHITCEAVGPYAATSTIYLGCPITASQLCSSNCSVPCSHVGNDCRRPEQLSMMISCKYRKYSDNHVIVDYAIDSDKVRTSGRWKCMHRGENSDPITIDAAAPRTTTRPPTTTRKLTTVKVPDYRPPDVSNEGKPEQKKPEQGEEPTYKSKGSTDKDKDKKFLSWFHLTRPELVLVLVGVLGFSLFVNLAFCIRCVLVKQYVENLRLGDNDQGCLESCLCMGESTYQSTTGKRRRYSLRHDEAYEVLPGGGGSSNGGVSSAALLNSNRPSAQFEFDPQTGMVMIPVGKLSATPGTFPRQHHHNGYVTSQTNGQPGYNNIILLQSPDGTPTVPPIPRPRSSQVLYDDVPGEMKGASSTGAIYGYHPSRRAHLGSREGMLEDYEGRGEEQFQARASVNEYQPALPPPHPALLEEEEETGETVVQHDPTVFLNNGEMETNLGGTLPQNQVHSSPHYQHIDQDPVEDQHLYPYPLPPSPSEDESAYTVDLIQHCAKNKLESHI